MITKKQFRVTASKSIKLPFLTREMTIASHDSRRQQWIEHVMSYLDGLEELQADHPALIGSKQVFLIVEFKHLSRIQGETKKQFGEDLF